MNQPNVISSAQVNVVLPPLADVPKPATSPVSPHHRRTACRLCGASDVQMVLSLGSTPLANAFLDDPNQFEQEARYPLALYFCQSCALVQLMDVIDPITLFRHYNYVTGTSDTISAHNIEYARTIVNALNMGPRDLVIEIASNDGSLLQCFQAHGVRVLGIEPAANIAEIARARGIETIDRFFDSVVANDVLADYGPARAVIANNVLAHVDEPVDFLRGCKQLLAQDGLITIEVPYLNDLLENLEYDTIYHEHLSYFSIQTVSRLCEAAGLVIVGIELVPIHGGSVRMLAGHCTTFGNHTDKVMALIEHERETGLLQGSRYVRFADQVAQHRRVLRERLSDLRQIGKTVAAYGAPAKGNTLLNYCGIGTELVSFTVDKSSLKVGRFTPGMHIPILPVSTLLELQPDYVLVLAWNFAAEIIRQQSEYSARGGRFLIPLAQPHPA